MVDNANYAPRDEGNGRLVDLFEAITRLAYPNHGSVVAAYEALGT